MVTNEELLNKIIDLEKRVRKLETEKTASANSYINQDDALLEEAKVLSKPQKVITASFLQRRLAIGYARAARILDQLEKLGVIGPADGPRPRKVIK